MDNRYDIKEFQLLSVGQVDTPPELSLVPRSQLAKWFRISVTALDKNVAPYLPPPILIGKKRCWTVEDIGNYIKTRRAKLDAVIHS